MRTAIITVSSSVVHGEREDESGELLAQLAEQGGCKIAATEAVSDDQESIEHRLRQYVDSGFDLVFTTGGTGLTPDDVTPEATSAVIERSVPGIAEAMRAASLKHTPHGMLSREVTGVAGSTLIINFPGSPKAVKQLFAVIAPVLAHAVRTIGGDHSH